MFSGILVGNTDGLSGVGVETGFLGLDFLLRGRGNVCHPFHALILKSSLLFLGRIS